jgi:hypothetical protein
MILYARVAFARFDRGKHPDRLPNSFVRPTRSRSVRWSRPWWCFIDQGRQHDQALSHLWDAKGLAFHNL